MKRNYGIDLLRVIAMLYVVILHSLGAGGVLETAAEGSITYKTAWAVEIAAFGAVNIFAIISGYVSYSETDKPINLKNYLSLWTQIVFYGVILTVLFNFKYPADVSKRDLVEMIFPVTKELYWYFTAYTGLFFVKPVIDRGVRSIKSGKIFLLVLILIFSFMDNLSDSFDFDKGYSFAWLTILYMIGLLIKKENILQNSGKLYLLIMIVVMHFITWLWKMYFSFEGIKLFSLSKDTLIERYNSPTIVIASILYVILFSKINISPKLYKIIEFFSTSCFTAYILNCHRFVWSKIMTGLLSEYTIKYGVKVVLIAVLFSLCFVIVSVLIDKIRYLLFKLFMIDRLFEKIDIKVKSLIYKKPN